MNPPPVATRELVREERFNTIWTQELNKVFADVAPYYDRANYVASLGLWNWFLDSFMSTIEVQPNQRVLDVCAGTNAIGIALLRREPSLEVHAIDRSAEMQDVGRQRAAACGFHIHSVIGDVHELPFPDNHFDCRDVAVCIAAPARQALSSAKFIACSSRADVSITATCCVRPTR